MKRSNTILFQSLPFRLQQSPPSMPKKLKHCLLLRNNQRTWLRGLSHSPYVHFHFLFFLFRLVLFHFKYICLFCSALFCFVLSYPVMSSPILLSFYSSVRRSIILISLHCVNRKIRLIRVMGILHPHNF